jgi:hypothetical protein
MANALSCTITHSLTERPCQQHVVYALGQDNISKQELEGYQEQRMKKDAADSTQRLGPLKQISWHNMQANHTQLGWLYRLSGRSLRINCAFFSSCTGM